MAGMMQRLRTFMFERVYLDERLAGRKEAATAVTRHLVEYHLEHPEHIPDTYREHDADRLRQVTDDLAVQKRRRGSAINEEMVSSLDQVIALVSGLREVHVEHSGVEIRPLVNHG